MDETEIVLNLYATDSSKLSSQLQDILIIRGWAISIYSILIGGSIFLNQRLYSLFDFLIIIVFYLLEVTYDSYRIVLFHKTKIYEKWLVENAHIPSEIATALKNDHVETKPITIKEARKKASSHSVRLFVYLTLTVITFAYLFLL